MGYGGDVGEHYQRVFAGIVRFIRLWDFEVALTKGACEEALPRAEESFNILTSFVL